MLVISLAYFLLSEINLATVLEINCCQPHMGTGFLTDRKALRLTPIVPLGSSLDFTFLMTGINRLFKSKDVF